MAVARSRRPRSLVRFLVAASALALGASLAACTTGGDPAPDATSATPTPSPSVTGEGPLEVAVFGDRTRRRVYRQVVEAYRVENPDAEVELTTYPDSEAALDPYLTALEQGWEPDVLLADYRTLPQLVATQGLQPVDTMLEERGLEFGDDYQRVGLEAFGVNARLQCMPAEVTPLVVYYNRQLFRRSQPGEPVELPDAENPTWEWEAFETVARATAGLDQLGPVKGAWFPADVETLTAFLRSAGTDVVDDSLEPTSLNLTSDEALEVLTALTSFARDSSVSLTADELARRDAVEWFAAGRLGMLVATRDVVPRLRAADGLRFDVLPLPSFGRARSVAYMNGWCVNAASEQASQAGDFVAFAVGPEASAIASRSGAIVPSGLDALHDRSFTQPRQQPAAVEFYSTAIRRAEPMPYSAAWNEVAADVERVLAVLYTDPDLDLEAALEPRMERLNERSVALFTPELEQPEEEPTE